jgi:tRNA(Ile)-lysidine synthase
MALAALYARAQRTRSFLPPAHGFVVDHKARKESTEEAKWVADQLHQKCELNRMCLSFAHC